MPSKVRGLAAFYLTWAGKAVLFLFFGLLLFVPWYFEADFKPYFLVAGIYLIVVAAMCIALQIVSCSGKVEKRTHPIVKSSSD